MNDPAPIPVWKGEFGLKLRFHVPQVHALLQDTGARPVEIERGEEALYPLASGYRVRERGLDDDRRGSPHRVHPREARFVPAPFRPFKKWADPVRVGICPRLRQYGSGKNWDGWQMLADNLPGPVAALGAPDSSALIEGEGIVRTWEYDRFLDATIQAMLEADLVIATDAGLAHLAVLCGRPLLMVTYRGRVAPGPVLSATGKVLARDYWLVRWGSYYVHANHCHAPIRMMDGWEDPKKVARAAEHFLRSGLWD